MRRPLARLDKLHGKGKRGFSQRQSHLANLHRELREDDRNNTRPRIDPREEGK
jgi:hypothetical protein